MPHVVVEGAGNIQGLYHAFNPIVQRTGSEILKVQEFYLAKSGREALLDSITIEQGAACNFFVQLKQHDKTITVRLLPATDPEKTPAVKRVMALVAGFIRKVYPDSQYGKTNLQEYLEPPAEQTPVVTLHEHQTTSVAMTARTRGVILVGHGGIPKDCPQELVTRLKRLESQRRAAGTPPSQEEIDLDSQIRRWPRTPATDPYRSGLEAVAARLRPHLDGALFAVAYNEFCAPSLEESVEELLAKGATEITVTTTMFTPGGSHSELEIPEILAQLRQRYPAVLLRYAWPFDLDRVATLMTEQLKRYY